MAGNRFRIPMRWLRIFLAVLVIGAIIASGIAVAAGPPFTDDDTSPFETDINWLFNTGVTLGCGGTNFCPDNFVTRGQMAAFMHRFAMYLGMEAGSGAFLKGPIITRVDSQSVPDGGNATALASCQAGETLIGGGGNLSMWVSDVFLLSSRPNPNTDGSTPTAWQASAINPAGGTLGIVEVRAYAMCAS